MYYHNQKMRSRGFSLTELSAAIAIIAVIAGSAISVAITSDDAAKIEQTKSKLDAIESALAGYLSINSRLPCPSEPFWGGVDDDFAIENIDGVAGAPNPAECVGAGGYDINSTNGELRYGTLPIKALQLPSEYYNDGWGRPFTYVVDTRFINNTATNTLCTGLGAVNSSGKACFIHAPSGDVSVNDSSGLSRTTEAVVFILSHGPNGHGAYFANGITGRFNAVSGTTRALGSDELNNSHLSDLGADTAFDTVFVQKDFIRDEALSGDVFDDISRYMTKTQLIREAGANLYQTECLSAKEVLDSPGSNDCVDAANSAMCELFAQKIYQLCL
jgi:prepilin-type N-terminal cleavage/methylation domain-containing protein